MRVDLEFTAYCCTTGIVSLAEHAIAAAVLIATRPGDDKIAGRIHCYRVVQLTVAGVRIDLEFTSHRRAGCVVQLAEHAIATAILIGARPDDDKVACRIGGDRATAGRSEQYLRRGCGCVDLEFAA